MPRGRMLNKSISVDEEVAKLSEKAIILFTFCIPHLDVDGKISANVDILKGVVVPYLKNFTKKKIEKCIQELAKSPLVLLYGSEHKYMQFLGFNSNQKINKEREAPSEIPDPPPELLKSKSRSTPAKVKLNLSKVNLSKDKSSCSENPKPEFSERAKKLKSLMLQNNPKAKIPKSLDDWANGVRLMVEQDKRTLEEIDKVIEWSQKDDFWKTNILSMGKLRKQFDQLTMKMNLTKKPKYCESGICFSCHKQMADCGDYWHCTDCQAKFPKKLEVEDGGRG